MAFQSMILLHFSFPSSYVKIQDLQFIMSDENPLITRQETDWTLCCLCQQKTNQDLRCPYKKKCYLKAYQTLEEDFTARAFTESNVMA